MFGVPQQCQALSTQCVITPTVPGCRYTIPNPRQIITKTRDLQECVPGLGNFLHIYLGLTCLYTYINELVMIPVINNNFYLFHQLISQKGNILVQKFTLIFYIHYPYFKVIMIMTKKYDTEHKIFRYHCRRNQIIHSKTHSDTFFGYLEYL